MAPIEPENPEFDDTDGAEAPGEGSPRVSGRPDWLVGADEGANDEIRRNRAGDKHAPPLRLVRPGEVAPSSEDEESPRPSGFERLPTMGNADTARTQLPGARSRQPAADHAAAWQAAASSVPKLRRTAAAAPAAAARPASRNFEADEDDDSAMPELSDDSGPMTVAAPALKPLEEQWWMIALDAVQTNRRIQIALGALVLLLIVLAFEPWQPRPIPLSRIRRHTQQFDGRQVLVHGRVGDVFPIAGGFTYFLLQGRDTIVVFTHTRRPVMDERLTVRGTVSTGYLDGLPRQAIFEDTK